MTNADRFKNLFGIYATELWSMPEKDFLKWLNSEVINCSEMPNSSDTISRQAAIDALGNGAMVNYQASGHDNGLIKAIDVIKGLPSAEPQWIACSERLPEDNGDYLVCPSDSVLEDSDFSDRMIMPYDADCEAFGWWVARYDSISLGFVDSDFNEFEVLAWMPLPEPYRVDDNE